MATLCNIPVEGSEAQGADAQVRDVLQDPHHEPDEPEGDRNADDRLDTLHVVGEVIECHEFWASTVGHVRQNLNEHRLRPLWFYARTSAAMSVES